MAAGLVPLAHASDSGGSIRLPAALAGLFGFKPSAGATAAATPMVNDFVRLTSEHCVSRSVRDSAAFLAVTAVAPSRPVEPGPLPALRIGVYTASAFGEPASAEAAAAVARAAALCEELGHHVDEIAPPPVDGERISHAFFTVAGAAIAGLREMMAPMLGRPLAAGDVEPFTWALLAWFDAQGPGARERALADLDAQGARMRGFLAGGGRGALPDGGRPTTGARPPRAAPAVRRAAPAHRAARRLHRGPQPGGRAGDVGAARVDGGGRARRLPVRGQPWGGRSTAPARLPARGGRAVGGSVGAGRARLTYGASAHSARSQGTAFDSGRA